MTRALLCVDLQLDFVEGGALAVAGGNDAANAIAEQLMLDTDLYPILAVSRDMHIDPGEHFSANPDYVDSWPVHCRQGTVGSELVTSVDDSLAARQREMLTRTDKRETDVAVFDKGHYTAAYSPFEGFFSDLPLPWEDPDWEDDEDTTGDLEGFLRIYGVTEIHIVGLAYDHCVKAAALDAAKRGFDTTVLKPYTAAVSDETASAATQKMLDAGVHVAGI